LGGDRDYVGGAQELRGFGAGRFYDRNSFASSVELRKKVFGFDASNSHVDVEVTPFIDVGDVAPSGTPLNHLHNVAGVGFRGVARPFIVGYVDIGYGNEGVAAFTGIDYPF
jgi:hemolysin activation/secretion protein